MRARTFVLIVLLLAGTSVPAAATDYYLSATGNDAQAGTISAPWRTLSRANGTTLRPGDRVLLRAGDTFAGSLTLDAADAGTAAAPIVIASHGTGRATIASGSAAGLSAYNTSGISIANINFTGSGGTSSGISFYTDLPGDVKLPFIRVDGVDVSGYGRDGIEVGAWNGRTGFADVRVTNAVLHGNARTGLFTYAQLPNAHQQVYVGRVTAYDNPGVPGASSNSGSGIVLSGVDGGTIERSVARGNGWLCSSIGGPVGIWTYDSTRLTIQHNESFANRTGASWDGGGFDLDQNVSNSIVQYNYSHDNDGAGFLLAQSLASGAHHGNIIRYNISKNDGRANSYGGIEVWGGVTSAEIYNNTVIMSPAASGTARAIRVWNDGVAQLYPSSVHFQSNTLLISGVAAIDVTPAVLAGGSDLTFAGNYISGAAGNPDPATTGVNEVLLTAASATMSGAWIAVADATAAGGARAHHPDQGAAKLIQPYASPANYFDLTFVADAGRPYRLWIRGAAQGNAWTNDSVFVQFSDSVDASGAPTFRLGTTSATMVSLEDDNGAGVSGWGWQDNGWGTGVLGQTIAFATSGLHTIRVQTREDGMSIDQIVLSAGRYRDAAPGTLKNDTTIVEPAAAPSLPAPAPTPSPTPAPAAAEVVVHASDLPATSLHGDWTLVNDPTAADGVALLNLDRGAAKIGTASASPVSYVDVPFNAEAGVRYQVWLRMRASGDGYANDSVHIQFSGAVDAAGNPVARLATTQSDSVVLQDYSGAPIAGWGWNDNGWTVLGTPYTFATGGAQTLRIQQREDGILIDQIVISPARYLSASPGKLTGDATIVR